MKTIIEIEQKILKLITTIEREYPELSKYLTEMPVYGAVEISIESLENYCQSLEELIEKYSQSQQEVERNV